MVRNAPRPAAVFGVDLGKNFSTLLASMSEVV